MCIHYTAVSVASGTYIPTIRIIIYNILLLLIPTHTHT